MPTDYEQWMDYLVLAGHIKREELDEVPALETGTIILACECGAEKCKTTHASWCPKYK